MDSPARTSGLLRTDRVSPAEAETGVQPPPIIYDANLMKIEEEIIVIDSEEEEAEETTDDPELKCRYFQERGDDDALQENIEADDWSQEEATESDPIDLTVDEESPRSEAPIFNNQIPVLYFDGHSITCRKRNNPLPIAIDNTETIRCASPLRSGSQVEADQDPDSGSSESDSVITISSDELADEAEQVPPPDFYNPNSDQQDDESANDV